MSRRVFLSVLDTSDKLIGRLGYEGGVFTGGWVAEYVLVEYWAGKNFFNVVQLFFVDVVSGLMKLVSVLLQNVRQSI